ncbi:hypothetical protein HPP92_018025 [Vanilla planifolia]|uniref:Uncharacterized protein n=1 Tax=Vanilla planifolia TaxID=51239 RepID=A0A835Q503_VANPL|nr:hypothetical protein HPP92_018025 [Vanilla planifolia]
MQSHQSQAIQKLKKATDRNPITVVQTNDEERTRNSRTRNAVRTDLASSREESAKGGTWQGAGGIKNNQSTPCCDVTREGSNCSVSPGLIGEVGGECRFCLISARLQDTLAGSRL